MNVEQSNADKSIRVQLPNQGQEIKTVNNYNVTLDRETYSKAVGWGLKQASATFVSTREEEEDWLGCFNYSKLGHVNQFVPEIA